MSDTSPLLDISNLKKYFYQHSGLIDSILQRGGTPIRAVDDVTFTLDRNEVIGVIGESGCGKTTLLNTLMGLYEPTGGSIRYKGRDITGFNRKDWKAFRSDVQLIFQDPFNSLDPKMTVDQALQEPLEIHDIDDRETRVREVLKEVELDPPERFLDRYPSQLSGGEMQRVSIGRALILEPEIILADEPVSMLDVSTQASILKLLSRLIDEHDVSMFYISHDLSTVAYVCDRINVMYLGRIVESAPTLELLDDPLHPYSRALIDAIPVPDPRSKRQRTQIEGSTPDPTELEEGCRFKDRCPDRMDICDQTPAYIDIEDDHNTACHLYYDHETYMDRFETADPRETPDASASN